MERFLIGLGAKKMIKDLVTLLAPILLVLGVLLFVGAKWLRILDMGRKGNQISLFFRSLLFYPEQQIRNTFEAELKRYLEYSNRINKLFYGFFIIVFSLFLLLARF